MHSEHLQNVSLGWVSFGWFLGFALASSLLLLMAGAGLLTGDAPLRDAILVDLSVVAGWGVGGFFVGFRTAAAPILHGAAMALFTFLAWFVVNLLLAAFTIGISAWESVSFRVFAGALLIQGFAAILGCWMGYRYAPDRVE